VTNQGNNTVVKDAFKNNPPPSLPTLDETPCADLWEPPLLPIKSLNTSATMLHYIIVPVEEVEPKKKKQLIQHQAYWANINQQI
jgi:hypothetical protein